jgi:hypothetical protein
MIPTKKILGPILEKELEREFGISSNLNKDIVKLISINNDFLPRIKSLQRELNIPSLELGDDLIILEHEDMEIDASYWLENHRTKKEKLRKKILQIMVDFGLPINFYDWIEAYVLYNKKPRWIPLYSNYDLLLSMFYLNELKGLPLTTGEKNFLKREVRKRLKMNKTGRLPKKTSKAYQNFLEFLVKIKNKRRRLKNIDLGLKIRSFKSKIIPYYDYTVMEESKMRTTLESIAGKIAYKKFSSPTDEDVKKAYQNIRKAKERVKKQAIQRLKKQEN